MSFKKNSVFLNILAVFVAVTLVVSLAFAVLRLSSVRAREENALKNLEMSFNNDAQNVQRMISQLQYSMAEVAVKIASDSDFDEGKYLEKNELRGEMSAIIMNRRQNEFSPAVETAFIVDRAASGYVYSIAGTYAKDDFEDKYVSGKYDMPFWHKETEYCELFTLFPADSFLVNDTENLEKELIPVVYKPQKESRFAVVVLVNAEKMKSICGEFAIYDSDWNRIYAAESMRGIDASQVASENLRVPDGRIFKFLDTANGNLNIVRFVDTKGIFVAAKEMSFGAVFVFILLISLAVGISVFSALRICKKVKRITAAVDVDPRVTEAFPDKVNGLDELFEAVKLLVVSDARSMPENTKKDSVIDSLLLQSRLRDVYVEIEDIEKSVDVHNEFSMAYFKVNYKPEFTEMAGDEAGKATFFLKQLIEMYLETWGISSTTFQIKDDGIVSVFDKMHGEKSCVHVIEELVSKLENESEYAYFIVSVSDEYDSSANIKTVYKNLIDIAKFGIADSNTQILLENSVKRETSRFYFSVEEMGKLSAILQNGAESEVERKVDEIFEFNIKKQINFFELHLLCIEVINCAVKLLNRTLHTVPEELALSDIYKRLENEGSPEICRSVCVGFLLESMKYIRQNKREEDYIINYILDYVDNHYADDIYLNLFAEKLKLTGAYISSYFKEKMNVNLSDYVNNYRIKRAVELSANPQNKNKDIAVMVGLPNINTFIRLFKKYTGYTPGEYRKKHFGDNFKS